MITLYGSPLSNYFNKVKLVLIEKGIPFREEALTPSQDESVLRRSPLGKIPFIETEQGFLSESLAIVEYLEEAYPEKPLYPADPYARAKCRELILHLELNVETFSHRLFAEAFFGRPLSPEIKQEVRDKLQLGLKGLARLAAFRPFLYSDALTLADCAAWPHLTMATRATEIVYGEDLVAANLPWVKDYLAMMETRPSVQQVAADRARAVEAFYASKQQ